MFVSISGYMMDDMMNACRTIDNLFYIFHSFTAPSAPVPASSPTASASPSSAAAVSSPRTFSTFADLHEAVIEAVKAHHNMTTKFTKKLISYLCSSSLFKNPNIPEENNPAISQIKALTITEVEPLMYVALLSYRT